MTAPGGIGERAPQTPSVASHCVRYSFHPQSLRDSPGGARGKISPKPLRSLRTACTIPSTPSHFVTAPVGHGERFPRNPFGRFAPKPVTFGLLSSEKNRAVSLTDRPVFIFIDHPLFGDRLVFRCQGLHRGPAKDVGDGTEAEDDEVACRFALKAKKTKIRLTGIDK